MKVPILTLSSVLMKICQIPYVIFQTTSQFLFIFACFFSVTKDNYSVLSPVKRYNFARKRPIKVQIFETFECSNQNSPNSCHFWNNKLVFLQILHRSSVSWNITPPYFLSWNFIYFQQKQPIKVHIWWNFTWAVKTLKLCTFMVYFCKNHIKFQLKKYRRVISHDTEEWCKG